MLDAMMYPDRAVMVDSGHAAQLEMVGQLERWGDKYIYTGRAYPLEKPRPCIGIYAAVLERCVALGVTEIHNRPRVSSVKCEQWVTVDNFMEGCYEMDRPVSKGYLYLSLTRWHDSDLCRHSHPWYVDNPLTLLRDGPEAAKAQEVVRAARARIEAAKIPAGVQLDLFGTGLDVELVRL